MRKKIFKQTWAQKAVALGLSAAMVIPSSAAYLGTTTTMAAELPTPVAVYEAGETQDLDTTGINPSVEDVSAEELWEGAKAWSLKNSEPEAAPSTTTEKSIDCSVTVKNPFAGDKTLVEEVSIDEDGYPEWNTGVTITYWVKTLGDFDKTSSIISFTSEGVKTYEKNCQLKHRIASEYTAEKAMDPKSEYYSYQLPEKFDGKPVYDFYKFAKERNIDVNDPYKMYDIEAIPQLICVSPNFPQKAEETYVYVGKHDDAGNPSEKLTADNTFALSNSLFIADGNCLANKVSYDDYKTLESPEMEYGFVNGLLQLHTDNTMFFGEDITKAKRYKNGVDTGSTNIIADNSIQFYASTADDASPEDDTDWHFVAFVIQNDHMYSIIDGETVIDQTTNAGGFDAKKSFNLGTGLRQSTCESGERYRYNANRFGKSIMEWLTAETTKLNIGGASLEIMTAYTNEAGEAAVDTTEGTQIACVKMYNEVLDDETIAAIYEAKDGHKKAEPTDTPATDTPATDTPATDTPKPTDTPFMYGDVDGNNRVDAQDALGVLKCVVKLEEFNETQTKAGDVDLDGSISSQDALAILQYVVKIITVLPVK